MSQIPHVPKYYQRGLRDRITEGLRYGGGVGQWSWLIHRLTGLGILLFLIIHVVDTFFVVAFPALYDHTVAIYGGTISGVGEGINGYYWPLRWAFRLGELGLIASVLFHALNGVRIVLLDFWPKGVMYQKQLFRIVQIAFWVIMLLVTIRVVAPLFNAPEHLPAAKTASVTTPSVR
jgi:succinate dehydrogenase / fumarate reductase cytochrome b subunit